MKRNLLGFIYLSFMPALLSALPQSPEIVSGSMSVSETRSEMLIEVSDRAIINYQRFDVGQAESVRFLQPSSSSSVLNRVVGSNPSKILGRITSNGRIVLVNPQGVYFGRDAIVDTGSLVVSTLDIMNQDFLEDRFSFRSKGKAGSIHNEGTLTSKDFVALIAPQIKNEGLISAKAGRVLLASAEAITLSFSNDDLMSFLIEEEAKESLLEHLGSIEAKEVFIQSATAKKAIQSVINTEGLLEGQTLIQEGSVIRIAHASCIDVSNKMSGEIGGRVHILGDHLELLGARIDASGDSGGGTILIGGEYKGGGSFRNAITTTVDESSVLTANALTEGNGGRVIVWADDTTLFDGKIFAKGGELSGHGGFVETSGKERLGVQTGYVNTLASNGLAGTWLLDPNTITIASTGSGTLAQAANCADTATALSITPATIDAAASNVVLCASVSITQNSAQNIAMTNSGVGITFEGSTTGVSTTLNGTVTTQGGPIAFISTAITLAGSSSLDTTNAGATGAGANISFDSSGTINGAQTFGLRAGTAGVISIGAAIGGVTPLVSLTFTSGLNIILGASITLTGANAISLLSAPVILTGSSTITVPGNSASTFISTGVVNGNQALTLVTGTLASISISGAIGTTTPLASFSLTTGSVSQNSPVKTVGSISYTVSNQADNVTASGFTTLGGTMNFSGRVVSEQTSFVIDSTGAGTVPAGANITFSGTTSVLDNIGSNSTVTILAGTSGTVTFNGPVAPQTAFNLTGLVVVAGSIVQTSTAQIETGGVFSYTAPSISIGGNITTSGIPISLTGAVTFTGAATFDTTNSGGVAAGANVNFSSTVNGAFALTLRAGTSGNVVFAGAVGGTTPLTNLTFTSASTVQIGSNLALSGANALNFSIPVVLTGTSSTISCTNNNITFSNILNGSAALTLTGGSGTLTFSTVVGGTTPLASLNATSATITQTSTVKATGFVSYTGSTVMNVEGNITTSGGLISFTGPVVLTNTSLLDSTVSGGATGGANISFSSTVNGVVALTLQGGTLGTVIFGGAVGGTTPLTSLTVTAATVTQNSTAVLSGALSYTGSSGINLGGNATTSGGTMSFIGPVTLTNTLSLDSTHAGGTAAGANISFSSTLNGAFALTFRAGTAGDVSFVGAVGGSTALTNLTFTSAALIQVGANVTVTGANPLVFSEPVSLTATSTITSNGANITFSSTLNGANLLTIAGGIGTLTFSTAVGGTTPLGSLTATSKTITQDSSVQTTGALAYTGSTAINIEGNITTSGGSMTFTGPVALTNSNTLDATDGGIISSGANISFSSTLNGAVSLTLLAGTSGVITFTGAVGGVTSLTALSLVSAELIQIAGNITLTGANSLTFPSPVILEKGITITNPNNITFSSTIDGLQELILAGSTGTLTFTGAVGGTTPLENLVATSATITQSSSVKTIGTISYTGSTAINIAGNLTTVGSSISLIGPAVLTNALTFDTTNTEFAVIGGNISFSSTVNGASALTLEGGTSGVVTFTGVVGSTTPLTSLSVIAGTIVQSSSVQTAGAISYTAATVIDVGGNVTTNGSTISLIGPTTLTSSATFDSTDAGTTATGANISFSSTVNGTFGLTLRAGTAGDISFSGAVGGLTPLTNLGFTSGALIQVGSNITVTGANPLTFSSPVSLTGASTIASNNANISFNSTLNGNEILTLEGGTGTLTFTGAVGGTTALTSLTAVSNTITQSSTVQTVGDINYTGSTAINIGGSITTSGGTMGFTGPIVLTGSATLDSTDAGSVTSGANISFSSTLNGAFALAFKAGTLGDVSFDGAIGGVTPLTNLTFTSGDVIQFLGNVTLSGSNPLVFTSVSLIEIGANIILTSTSSLTFPAPIILTGPSTITDSNNNITFSSTIDGLEELTVVGGTGTLTFTGAVGGNTPLANLAATSATITQSSTVKTVGTISYTGSTAINIAGNLTTITGSMNFIGPVSLSNALTFDTTDAGLVVIGGNISFSSTVNGASSLTLDGGTSGVITFTGAVGGTTPLTNLSVISGTIVQSSTMQTAGAISYTASTVIDVGGNVTTNGGTISLSGPTTLTGNVTFDSTDAGTTATGANISFPSTVNGAFGLTLRAGTAGDISFSGAVGGLTPLTNLGFTSGALIQIGANITVTGANPLTFSSPVSLTGLSTITSNNANISFSSTLNGNEILTLEGGTGTLTFSGAVGGTTALTSLTAVSNTITQDSTVQTVGDINYTGSTAINIEGNITTSGGTMDFAGAVALTNSLIFDSTDGGAVAFGAGIEFSGTLNGAASLTFKAGTLGNVLFEGVVGGITPLTNLTFTSADVVQFSGSVTLSGSNPLVFTSVDVLKIGANITLISTSALIVPVPIILTGPSTITDSNNNITFSSTIDGLEELTVVGGTGTLTFTGAVGETTPLETLSVTSATITQSSSVATEGSLLYTGSTAINIGGNITTSDGTIMMAGPVSLSSASTFDTTNAGLEDAGANITFSSTLNGSASLTLNAGLTGIISFTGAVGGVTPLTNLVFDGASSIQIGSNVAVSGANPLVFSESVVINSTSTITSNGASMTFSSTLDGSHAITLQGGSGTLTLSGAVGSSLAPTSLSVTSAAITQNSTVKSSGAISYTDTGLATIAGAITAGSFTQSGGGTVSLSASISASSTILFTNAIAFSSSLSLSAPGGITLDSAMIPSSSGIYNLTLYASSGAITAPQLGSPSEYINVLTITAATISVPLIYANIVIENGTETISSNITAPGAYLLFSSPTTVATGTFTIDVTGGSAPGSVTFASTLDGPGGLTFKVGGGNLTFEGVVGGITSFGNATVTSAQNVFVAEAFTGNSFTQVAGGTTTIAGVMNTSSSTGVSLKGTIMNITGSIITAGSGPVTFQNSNLLTISGSISSNGNISQSGGGAVSLGNTLTTTNGSAGSAGVSFTNAITLTDDVVINTSTGGGAIAFGSSSTIDGLESLSLIAGAGDISLGADVGSFTPLDVFTIYSAADVDVSALTAASFIQAAATGTTTIGGALIATGDAGVVMVGNIFDISAPIETLGKGPVIFQNSGLLTIDSGATINAAGPFLQKGSGSTNVSANVTAR